MSLRHRVIQFGLAAMLWSLSFAVEAQQSAKAFRIGVLNGGIASNYSALLEGFRRELSKLGWVEGKNITIEYRFADQKQERLPELAVELVRLKVDVIVVGGLSKRAKH